MTNFFVITLFLIWMGCIDVFRVQAFIFTSNSKLNLNAVRTFPSHATNAVSTLISKSQTRSDFNYLLSYTRLNVTTKNPPEPPGHGKSVLDIILLPLLTVALIPVVLLVTDVNSIEISVVSKESSNESLISGRSIQTTDATINPINFKGSSNISTGIESDNDYRYDSELSTTRSSQEYYDYRYDSELSTTSSSQEYYDYRYDSELSTTSSSQQNFQNIPQPILKDTTY
jgi:hypothetical protein